MAIANKIQILGFISKLEPTGCCAKPPWDEGRVEGEEDVNNRVPKTAATVEKGRNIIAGMEVSRMVLL